MDSVYDHLNVPKVDRIVSKYSPAMAPLMEIVGYSTKEMEKGQPESPLSNFTADVFIHEAHRSHLVAPDDKVFSITNFGGIRSNLPQGAIRIYDIYSVFPFDNSLVVVELYGSQVRKIMNGFASREKFEALGGVKIVVDQKKMTECLVGGSELKDDDIYKLITINFLLDGGDRMKLKDNAISIVKTDVFIRDAVIQYIRDLSAEGKVVDNDKDGRITLIKTAKNE